MVPGAGLEPARSFLRGILSPLCLPIPPPGLILRLMSELKQSRPIINLSKQLLRII